MNILHLTIKKKWFIMIASGEKTQEYREIKPHWISRLIWPEYRHLDKEHLKEYIAKGMEVTKYPFYDTVLFTNGYDMRGPKELFELKSICIGPPVPKWSDTGPGDVFVLTLGKQLDPNQPY